MAELECTTIPEDAAVIQWKVLEEINLRHNTNVQTLLSYGQFKQVGYGDYNGMQWTVRKRFSQGYQFDFNYTWSKSIDLASTREANPTGGSAGNTPTSLA